MYASRPLPFACALLIGLGAACAARTFAADATPVAPVIADESAEQSPAVSAGASATVLARVRDAALKSDWGFAQLQLLTDTIGPRLSGSPQLTTAITRLATTMRELGARVTLLPAKVSHWERGAEQAELVSYAGKPSNSTQQLHLTALGRSAATPANGLVAPVLLVRDLEELQARAAEVRGKIVLFTVRFDQRLADDGYAFEAYGRASHVRYSGPALAGKLGAVAALVRSIGGAESRLPHTGATTFTAAEPPIPAAALSAEDADLIARLAAQGPVSLRLTLTPRTFPDADSFDVIADWPGSELPGEYVIVSGHLDSWDLGTGAADDGVGVIGAAAVIELLHSLNLHARRSIRFIAWADEETSEGGADAYAKSVAALLPTQSAAIEADTGAGRALGFRAAIAPGSAAALKPAQECLAEIGAGVLERVEPGTEVGADIAHIQKLGVPAFAPLADTRHYFDYHHSAADTLDKVDPENMRTQIATMAVLAYALADLPQPSAR